MANMAYQQYPQGPGFMEDAKNVLFKGFELLGTPDAYLRGLMVGSPGEKVWSGRDVLERWGAVGPDREGLDMGDIGGFALDVLNPLSPTNLLFGWTKALGKGAMAGAKGLGGVSKAAAAGKGAEALAQAKSLLGAAGGAVKAIAPGYAMAMGLPYAGAKLMAHGDERAPWKDALGMGLMTLPLALPLGMAAMRKGGFKKWSKKNVQEEIARLDAESGVSSQQDIASQIERANRSARAGGATAGAGGVRAITPRHVLQTATPDETILDFGSGPKAVHTARLRESGLNATAHDFGKNVIAGVHDPDALLRQYSTVMASNVLNTQGSMEMLRNTLAEIRSAMQPGGRAVFNYPKSPRYSGLKPDEVAKEIKSIFGTEPVRVGGTASEPLWEVRSIQQARAALQPKTTADVDLQANAIARTGRDGLTNHDRLSREVLNAKSKLLADEIQYKLKDVASDFPEDVPTPAEAFIDAVETLESLSGPDKTKAVREAIREANRILVRAGYYKPTTQDSLASTIASGGKKARAAFKDGDILYDIDKGMSSWLYEARAALQPARRELDFLEQMGIRGVDEQQQVIQAARAQGIADLASDAGAQFVSGVAPPANPLSMRPGMTPQQELMERARAALGVANQGRSSGPSLMSLTPAAAGGTMLAMNENDDPTMNAIGTALLLGGLGLPLAMTAAKAGGKAGKGLEQAKQALLPEAEAVLKSNPPKAWMPDELLGPQSTPEGGKALTEAMNRMRYKLGSGGRVKGQAAAKRDFIALHKKIEDPNLPLPERQQAAMEVMSKYGLETYLRDQLLRAENPFLAEYPIRNLASQFGYDIPESIAQWLRGTQ